jgi:azurin
MDSTHHDSAENSGGFWNAFAQTLSIGLAAFSLLAGAAFIYGGLRYSRVRGPQPVPATPPPAATPAASGSAAASLAPAASASVAGGEIVIKPGTDNPLTYDIKSFAVKAGQKVKLTFNNQSAVPQPHNLILGKLGSKDRLIAAFTAMIADPNGMAKGYIPESPDIIVHTKLLNPGQSETLDFTAPVEKGDYPYICSFPGHSILMNGVMKVE